MTAALVTRAGEIRRGDRWTRVADAVDRRLLARVRGPVLDVGCGPGRHTVALAERGVPALGIDITRAAIAHASSAGATVIERCVFDRVPGAGRYATVLLLDGNVGIGANPLDLLRRCRALVRPGGCVIVETATDSEAFTADRVRLHIAHAAGPWFDWIDVCAHALPEIAHAAELEIDEAWNDSGRHFARLVRRDVPSGAAGIGPGSPP